MFTAAQTKLRSLLCCQYHLEELGHPAWPGFLGNSRGSSRPESLQEADTCLAALGRKASCPLDGPGWESCW